MQYDLRVWPHADRNVNKHTGFGNSDNKTRDLEAKSSQNSDR